MISRRIFIKNTSVVCAGGCLATVLVAGCKSVHYVSSPLADNRLTLKKNEFMYLHKEEIRYRSWVVVKSPGIPFPVGVFRADDAHFFASYLECSHQGCEVEPEGSYLKCPCHGSEYDNHGKVQHGPAEADLKSFAVETDIDNIFILLK